MAKARGGGGDGNGKPALVAYGSKHGSTREIAEAIAKELGKRGMKADCLAADDVDSVKPYGTVVLGSAVYMKRWRKDARRLLSREGKRLAGRDLWIFSSGPCGEQKEEDKDDSSWLEPPKVVKQAEKLGAREHVVFGGRVPLEPSNFVERAMLENTPDEFKDLRDWDEIRAWARKIADGA
ncbi:MAG TPA: flavodoxin domain-containing protein [Solirubrobacterales bacterium]|nr:flavodoxin domain-containing protein [Solirubrobacterales bacterium]